MVHSGEYPEEEAKAVLIDFDWAGEAESKVRSDARSREWSGPNPD